MTLRGLRLFLLGTLRGRLILSVAAVHAVMMTLFIVDLTIRQQALLLDNQVQEAVSMSQSLATSSAVWIAAHDLSGLQELVEAERRYPEMLFTVLTDERGRVLAHTDPSKLGLYLLDLPSDPQQTVFSQSAALVDVAVPALLDNRVVGWVRVGLGQKAASQKLAQITFMGILYALAAIAIGSLIAWQMGRRITQRLYAVQDTMGEVRKGLRTARANLSGIDEAAVIARDFNSMLDALDERDRALLQSEGKYGQLLQNIHVAVVVHGPDTRILMSNPMAQKLLGLTEDQLVGKTTIDPAWHFLREDGTVMPSEEYPANQVFATRQPLKDLVVGVHRPDLSEAVWVLVNADAMSGKENDTPQVIVTFIDITERKQAEAALRKNEAELRAFFSQSIDGCFYMMLDEPLRWDETVDKEQALDFAFAHQRITQINDAMLAQYGATREAMLNLTPNDFFEHNLEYGRDLWRRFFDAGMLRLESDERKLDGTPMWIEGEYIALYDAQGQMLGHFGIQRDVTERKRTEQALHEQEQHSQSLLRLSHKLEQAQTYADVLDAAQDEVREMIGYQNLWAYLFTPDKTQAKALFAKGRMSQSVMSEDGTATLTVRGDRMMEEIVETKEIVVVADARTDERTDKKIVAKMGNRTLVNVPILLFDRHMGSVGMGTFGDEGVLVPTASEQEYLKALASHMAVTLDRIHLLNKRQQMEQELAAREQEYRILLENIPDLIVRYDTNLCRIYVNPAWERASGLSAREVVNLPPAEIPQVPSPINAAYLEKLQQALITGTAQSIEFTWVNAFGATLFLEHVIVPEYDAHGKISGVLSVGRDITERKCAEEELRSSEEKFRAIIEQSAEGVALIDETGCIVEWNQANEMMTGMTRAEAIGLPLWELAMLTIAPERQTAQRRDRFKVQVLEALRTGQSPLFTRPVEAEFHPRGGGEKHYLHQTIFPIKTATGFRIASLTHDITERKQAEEKIKRHLDELERWYNVTLNREERIRELKREVNQLLIQRGESARYASPD